MAHGKGQASSARPRRAAENVRVAQTTSVWEDDDGPGRAEPGRAHVKQGLVLGCRIPLPMRAALPAAKFPLPS